MIGDIINNVKQFFGLQPDKPAKIFTVDSSIELAPNGDLNHDNSISSGDIVRFTFNIDNKTNNLYDFATFDTNLNRKQINFIHNLTNITGLNDDGKTITIPNLRIYPKQNLVISFDARINYTSKNDISISTNPVLLDKNKKTIKQGVAKQVLAKKLAKDKMGNIVTSGQ